MNMNVISAFTLSLALALALAGGPTVRAAGPYDGWRHGASIFLVTTADGAGLPAGEVVHDFPVLIRLRADSFDFSQARSGGEDLRFATTDGSPLAYQIEDWSPDRGEASVWVRVPVIKGDATQEVRVFWGRDEVAGESSGRAVFNESNGYLSVWHLGAGVDDEVGTVASTDAGTTAVAGVIGAARHLAGGKGVFGGEAIAGYPVGAGSHSSEAWFRPETPNVTVMAWGNEEGQGKVMMNFRSPPHVAMECYFSGADVKGRSRVPVGDWVHVMHTYEKGNSRLYVNGVLDGVSEGPSAPLKIREPARLWLGGWYHNYTFVGDLDEVRVSKVVRSAAWVRLQYENQKPLGSLTGPLVRSGSEFSVSPAEAVLKEGETASFVATAVGARKISWVLRRDGKETVVAVNSLKHAYDAGRVTADASGVLEVRALYPEGMRVLSIPLTIREAIPEPVFTLSAPAEWDGRTPLPLQPVMGEVGEASSPRGGAMEFKWQVSGPAVIKKAEGERLTLIRSMGRGVVTVTLAASNGGSPTTRSVAINITEPARDPWVVPVPGADERPVDGQFYARDDRGHGTLVWNGSLPGPGKTVFLKVFAGETLVVEQEREVTADRKFAFSVPMKAGLVAYRAEWGVDGRLLETVNDLVCGDAFIINGQSNAVSTDWGDAPAPAPHRWVRTFGATTGNPESARGRAWAQAVARGPDGLAEIGYWGMELGRRLVDSQMVPVCILNGAVGGTRIDQHQRSESDPTDVTSIYGRLLWRVRAAGLTHGIRGLLWHQGENDQGADGPSGGFGWETYREYFHALAGSWKQDFPNLQHVHMFQIWPKACSMGVEGSDNRLREVQRSLPKDFSMVSIMSTLGIVPPGGCHYPAAGYAEIARLVAPLVERDHYGADFSESITPPNLLRATFADAARTSLVLEFDQPVVWDEALSGQFKCNGRPDAIVSGEVRGDSLILKLRDPAPAGAATISYLDSASWSQETLLLGVNGLAALTFCEVAVTE